MSAKDFAALCKLERDAMLAEYVDPLGSSAVTGQLNAAGLSPIQREYIVKALDSALTDAFYTMLMALDGAVSLGGKQQSYRVVNGNGDTVACGDGALESAAFSALQSGAG